jgi:hypothetical protein
MGKMQQWGILIMTGVLLSACAPSLDVVEPGKQNYVYNGVDFGINRDENFKQGVRDACRTAKGDYTKNHALFNNNLSYKDGWESGLLKCKVKR